MLFNWDSFNSLAFKTRTNETVPRVPLYNKVRHDTTKKEDVEGLHDVVLEKVRNIRYLYSSKCSSNEAAETKECKDYKRELVEWERSYEDLRERLAKSSKDVEGSDEEGEGADWVMEMFLSRLAATISSSLRQVIVPGAPLYPTPYHPHLIYHFYQISSHSVCESSVSFHF